MKILIADDHAMIRAQPTKQLCADTGANVLEADSGPWPRSPCKKRASAADSARSQYAGAEAALNSYGGYWKSIRLRAS